MWPICQFRWTPSESKACAAPRDFQCQSAFAAVRTLSSIRPGAPWLVSLTDGSGRGGPTSPAYPWPSRPSIAASGIADVTPNCPP
eukprot:8144456-Pyramimonas_sp.AAC.1